MSGRRAAVAAGAVLVGLALPAPAAAQDVGSAELRSLAARAAEDPEALERLRAVDSVDGRPVDVAAALESASGPELRARLAALAAAPDRRAAPADAGEARAGARRILSERRFSGTRVEGPFRGLIERLGRLIAPLRDLVPSLDRAIPGGRVIVWIVLVAGIAALTWLVAGRTIRRRAAVASAAAARAAGARAETPAALERRADEAERRGAHDEALRLRFRAGLLRLDARGAIAFRASLPTADVSRTLRSDAFDRLAADFDEVVYGDRAAGPEDVATARREWERVLEATRS